ncbi:hypothetical protein CEXT_306231 [Caerostris extrusa]|uniref:Uncharacterized protein n=1 Tax=Caerostris extrusa TaxID=172846 RepID=A0AAV4T8S5_CAEEX|nr:hypothetical protein CEXT_306231 [Caerostris extrusa]
MNNERTPSLPHPQHISRGVWAEDHVIRSSSVDGENGVISSQHFLTLANKDCNHVDRRRTVNQASVERISGSYQASVEHEHH